MKISIITVVYNNEETVGDAIQSVLSQEGIDLEYILIDGASKDGTMKIVNSYGDKIDKVVSEPDEGIYDAMNKGVSLATGDVVGILNSDDVYNGTDILQQVMALFEKDNADCVYGNLVYVDAKDISKVVRYWRPGKQKSYLSGWHPAHPTFFVSKRAYDKFGLYRTELRVAADFEMMFRLMQKEGLKSSYLDLTMVRMRLGGESNKSIANIKRGFGDIKKSFEVNGYKMPLTYPVRRYIPKVKEFFIKGE